MNVSPLLAVSWALTTVALSLVLVVLWMLSGVARARSGVTNNPEDGARWNKPVQDHDPPAVARVLRAHANAVALILPFLALGAAYVLLNGNLRFAQAVFAVYTLTRVVHAAAYLRAWQPARSLSFALSFFTLLALAAAVVVRAAVVASAVV